MEFYCNWKTLSCFIKNSSVLNKGNRDRDEHYDLVLAITKACASKPDWFRVPLTSGRGDTIRYSQKNSVCVRGRLPNKTLTLFKTKICDFPCSIYDLTKNSKPYLRTDLKVNTPIQTCVIIDWQPCSDWCKHCEGPFVNVFIDDDEKVAFSKRHTQFTTKMAKIDTLFLTQTAYL